MVLAHEDICNFTAFSCLTLQDNQLARPLGILPVLPTASPGLSTLDRKRCITSGGSQQCMNVCVCEWSNVAYVIKQLASIQNGGPFAIHLLSSISHHLEIEGGLLVDSYKVVDQPLLHKEK